jgi:hypothetical protein
VAGSPAAALLPAKEVAHGVVAAFLGLQLLAALDGDAPRPWLYSIEPAWSRGFFDLRGASFLRGHFIRGRHEHSWPARCGHRRV